MRCFRKNGSYYRPPSLLGSSPVDLLRHFHSGMASLFQKYFFGKVLREEEKGTLMGSTYFLFSAPDHSPLSKIDRHCQPAHPDPLGYLRGPGGKRDGERFRSSGKTLEGSLAFSSLPS